MTSEIEANVALCQRLAAAGSIAVPIYSLPYPSLGERTAATVEGHIETRPHVGRRIRLGQGFIDQAKGVQKV